MRRLALPLALVLLSFLAVSAKKKEKKASLDPRLLNAQFVQVLSPNGDEMRVQTFPEDRQAIMVVRDALEKWGKYKVVYTQPDLIFEVRRGRLLGPSIGVGTGPGDQTPGGPVPPMGGVHIGTGVEASNAGEDMLSIYDARMGTDGPPIWRREMRGGLSGSAPLIQELKKDIEAAAAAQQQKKP